MEKISVGFALTGSYCTFEKAFEQIKMMSESDKWDILPILSENAYCSDTRFGTAEENINILEKMTGKKVLHTVPEVEPIGPQKMIDVLVVAPCTSNTLAKVANGINDTAVTMAIKSQIRNDKPVVLAISTNDALAAAARNIGQLLNQRNIFFVPMKQDDCINKPRSVVADFSKIVPTIEAALEGKQIQPILL